MCRMHGLKKGFRFAVSYKTLIPSVTALFCSTPKPQFSSSLLPPVCSYLNLPYLNSPEFSLPELN
uniref:Uncharacterized protein n=1 Tax=Anguilla anguilla TaxID=7936 RepID=A0A0E9WX58_ANGAN